jgi:hypothetical protein
MKVVGALMIAIVMACGPDARPFEENRVYTHALFATPEQCEAAQQYGINCDQEAVFCSNGRAILMFTDILNPATYRVDEDVIIVRFTQGTPEAPESMRFRLAADGMTMTDVGIARSWTRRTDLETAAAALYCEDG